MPFGLKNAGVTYQTMATALLHDMMHNELEVYIEDMIVKSKDRGIEVYLWSNNWEVARYPSK